MTKEIIINVERQNHGDWIKIFIPYASSEKMLAILQKEQGEILKTLKLVEGANSIDISGINCTTINLKIETPYETILKKLKLSV